MLTYANMNMEKTWQGHGARLRGESMIKYTTKVVMSSYGHILHKWKKVELKPCQSLSNHHGAQYWV